MAKASQISRKLLEATDLPRYLPPRACAHPTHTRYPAARRGPSFQSCVLSLSVRLLSSRIPRAAHARAARPKQNVSCVPCEPSLSPSSSQEPPHARTSPSRAAFAVVRRPQKQPPYEAAPPLALDRSPALQMIEDGGAALHVLDDSLPRADENKRLPPPPTRKPQLHARTIGRRQRDSDRAADQQRGVARSEG